MTYKSLVGEEEGCLMLYGGFNNNHQALSDCWKIDLSKGDANCYPYHKARLYNKCTGEVGIIKKKCSRELAVRRRPQCKLSFLLNFQMPFLGRTFMA